MADLDKCPDVGRDLSEPRQCPTVALCVLIAPMVPLKPPPRPLCRHALQVAVWAADAFGCTEGICEEIVRLEPVAPTEALPVARVLCACETEAVARAVTGVT